MTINLKTLLADFHATDSVIERWCGIQKEPKVQAGNQSARFFGLVDQVVCTIANERTGRADGNHPFDESLQHLTNDEKLQLLRHMETMEDQL